MKITIKYKKLKIPRVKGVADEFERIHFLGIETWVSVVAEEAGGGPFSGESLGSLRPVMNFLKQKNVDTSGTENVLEGRIANRKIKSPRDWFRLKNKSWRFHLTVTGQPTQLLKSPELGATAQSRSFAFFRDGNNRIFKFTFEPRIFQFLQNEKKKGISYTSPWNSFEKAQKAYNERVAFEIKNSEFLNKLFVEV